MISRINSKQVKVGSIYTKFDHVAPRSISAFWELLGIRYFKAHDIS